MSGLYLDSETPYGGSQGIAMLRLCFSLKFHKPASPVVIAPLRYGRSRRYDWYMSKVNTLPSTCPAINQCSEASQRIDIWYISSIRTIDHREAYGATAAHQIVSRHGP